MGSFKKQYNIIPDSRLRGNDKMSAGVTLEAGIPKFNLLLTTHLPPILLSEGGDGEFVGFF